MSRRLPFVGRSCGRGRCRSGTLWHSLLLLLGMWVTIIGWHLLDVSLTQRTSTPLHPHTWTPASLHRPGDRGEIFKGGDIFKGGFVLVRDALGVTIETGEHVISESGHRVVRTKNQPISNASSGRSHHAGSRNDQKVRSIWSRESGWKLLSRLKESNGWNTPHSSHRLHDSQSHGTSRTDNVPEKRIDGIPSYTKYDVPRAKIDVSRASNQNLSLTTNASSHTARGETRSDVDALLGSRGLKLITWYNVPYWHTDSSGTQMFDGCDVKCYVSQSASHAYVSDLVIFHDQHIPGGVPPPRPQNQVWLLFTMEAPPYVHDFNLEARAWRDQINWTMTFRSDSDIPLPYGRLVRRDRPRVQNWTEVIARKTGRVAWVVSHCGTHSLREKYVRALQEFVQVDVFGSCVSPSSTLEDSHYSSDLFKVIFRDYKFYLSFENSLCRDYITEKFFRSQAENIVNVVRGGHLGPRKSKKRRSDVVSTFPEGTFIDSDAFRSAFHLAEYIRYLDRNDTAYEEYLRKKAWYDVEPVEDITRQSFCTICQRLNSNTTQRKCYGNVVQWLNDGICHNPASDPI